jgi:hypothetical protein
MKRVLESFGDVGIVGQGVVGVGGGGGLVGVPVGGLAVGLQAVCSGGAAALLACCNAGLVNLFWGYGGTGEDAAVVGAEVLSFAHILAGVDAVRL